MKLPYKLKKASWKLIWRGVIVSLILLFIGVELEARSKNFHKEKNLTIASYIPVGYPYVYKGQKLFVDMVNERGKGIVHLNAYFGGSLLKGRQLLPGLQAGATDLIFQTGAYLLGSYPIIGIQMLPVWKSIAQAENALKMDSPLARLQNEVLKKKNLFQLATSGLIPEFLWTRKKLVRSPEDVKGLKIRVAGKVEAMVVKVLGGAPVTMPSAELPQALQRGVVDGALINPWTAQGRGTEQFCKYMLIYPMSWQSTPIYILRTKWDSWPEDVKKILYDTAVEWESRYMSKNGIINDKQLNKELIPKYEKAGMKAVYLTTEEKKRFDEAIRPVIKWWIKQVGNDVGQKALKLAGVSIH